MTRIIFGKGDYLDGRRDGYDAGLQDMADAMVPITLTAVLVTAVVATAITAAVCSKANNECGLLDEGNLEE